MLQTPAQGDLSEANLKTLCYKYSFNKNKCMSAFLMKMYKFCSQPEEILTKYTKLTTGTKKRLKTLETRMTLPLDTLPARTT
jgi:hypothetical protein